MEETKSEPNKLEESGRNPDGTWKEGHKSTGGRPKGETMKEFARRWLSDMPEDKKMEFLKTVSPDIRWRMAEGNPHQTQDTEVKGNITVNVVDYSKHDNKQI